MVHRRSDRAIQPPEIRLRGATTGDPTHQSSHWRSDPRPTITDPTRGSSNMEPLSAVRLQGSRSRWSSHREAALDSKVTGEPLSMVQPSGSRSRQYGYQGAALDGPVIGEPLSAVWLPGSRSRRSGHRGVAFDGRTSGEPLLTVG